MKKITVRHGRSDSSLMKSEQNKNDNDRKFISLNSKTSQWD